MGKTQIEMAKVDSLSPHPDNPRTIHEDKFEKLKASITAFPEMMEKRPLVINKENHVLGGNMRLAVLKSLGVAEVPIIRTDWTADQEREFMVKDNISAGIWDWDVLANEWDNETLQDWGLRTFETDRAMFNDPEPDPEPDITEPRITQEGYSAFEIVMKHEDKVEALRTLKEVKQVKGLENLSDSLAYIIKFYNDEH